MDGLPPGDPLPAWDEDEDEDVPAPVVSFEEPPPPPPPPPPPQQQLAAAPADADEAALKRSVELELDVPPHMVCSGCVRTLNAMSSELRSASLTRSNAAALHATELAQKLTSRIKVIRALQERLKVTHGAQVWLLLVRCAGVLELIARDLRETTAGVHRPGAQAGKAVALTKQAQALQQLQVRLRPQQEVASFGRDVVY